MIIVRKHWFNYTSKKSKIIAFKILFMHLLVEMMVPGSDHTHTVLLAISQANQCETVAPSVASTARWGCHKVLQPVPHHPPLSNIMTRGF